MTPTEALSSTPLFGPQEVAIVLNYPCGKARNRKDRSADRAGSGVPLSLSLDDLRSVLAVKGTLRRFARFFDGNKKSSSFTGNSGIAIRHTLSHDFRNRAWNSGFQSWRETANAISATSARC